MVIFDFEFESFIDWFWSWFMPFWEKNHFVS